MGVDGPAPSSLERLIAREVERVLGELEGTNQRALADNPAGNAVVADALRESIWLGIRAGCEFEGCSPQELDTRRESAWEDWWHMRDEAPEARSWPAFLAVRAPSILNQADELLAAAATELNLRGRPARHLRNAGALAAEAGAALARALAQPASLEDEPEAAILAPIGPVQPDRSVRVATAANQAEAELLQGTLQAAGIPSTWRRTGGDLPGLLAAGYREIYVPADAADEAQAILATSDLAQAHDRTAVEEHATRKVGLERTTLRLIGRATAVLVILTLLWEAAVGLQLGRALTLALVVVLLVAIAAMVGWRRTAA